MGFGNPTNRSLRKHRPSLDFAELVGLQPQQLRKPPLAIAPTDAVWLDDSGSDLYGC